MYTHIYIFLFFCRSQWPRSLRHRSVAAHLLRSWVRIPQGVWTFVCCVLSDRGLCDDLITRPEESYRLWCVIVCDLETSRMRRPWPALGRSAKRQIEKIYIYLFFFIEDIHFATTCTLLCVSAASLSPSPIPLTLTFKISALRHTVNWHVAYDYHNKLQQVS